MTTANLPVESKWPAGEAPPVNPFGLVGLILSALGMLSCGLLSPLGLLFSTIGLFRAPRGLAVLGVVLGILGSGGLMALCLVIFTSYLHHHSYGERVKRQLEAAAVMEDASDRIQAATDKIERTHADIAPEVERTLREFEKLHNREGVAMPPVEAELEKLRGELEKQREESP
jgi:hypothetical protein